MRIAFDATALPKVAGGAGNYILNLVDGLRGLRTGDQFYIVTKPEDVDRLGPWPVGSGFEPVVVRLNGRAGRLLWEQVGMPRLLRRLSIDLIHSPHYTVPLAAADPARVVTFHDLIFFMYPKYHDRVKVAFFQRMIRRASSVADHIITDSDSTKNDAVRLLGLAPTKLTTVHLAASPRYRRIDDVASLGQVLQKHDVAKPFVLAVCTLEPRKNLVGVIRAFRRLKDRGFLGKLVIAGAKGWEVTPVYEEVSRQALQDSVTFLGYVPDDDLPVLYSASDVFLYPSMYEGFGLPVLEAMACGAAVVTSDRSSLPEITGSAAVLCNPESPEDIAAKAWPLASDASVRAALGEHALRRADQFSWSKAAAQTYEVYVRAASNRRPRAVGASGWR